MVSGGRSDFARESLETLRLGAPLMGAQLLQLSMVFVDSIVVGHLGEGPLAAMAMATTFYNIVLLAALGVVTAVGPLVGQAHGAGKDHEIGVIVRHGLFFALGLGGLGALACLGAEPLLHLLRQPPHLIGLAGEYLAIVGFALPGQLVYVCFRQLTEATSDTRPSFWVAALGAVANIVGDYALVYGKWGAPALGAVGAAIATVGVTCVMAIALGLYVAFSSRQRDRKVFAGSWRYHPSLGAEIARVGIPASGAIVGEVAFFGATTFLMGTLGSHQLAAHQIALNAASFTFMIPLGLSFAVAIRVSQARGRGDAEGVRLAGRMGLALTGLIQSVASAIFLLAPGAVTALYTGDVALRESARKLLLVGGVFQWFDGLQVVGLAALRGLRDTKVPFYAALVSYWLIGLPVGCLMTFVFAVGPTGLWYGMLVALGVAAWLHHRRFEKSILEWREVAPDLARISA